ncbi:hypothetical protein [Rariglobus hedericola]|uniref:Uncharacterized protein n=1 Tax=Rariglobus hedericola TaxID=2597822 RepID=A0A556QMB5_9BACT|nr:hypothetical protein [Rariglobus hedericola]TSJ77732.1 hypothetical protein FPL22_00025 [Rariglobus hedericola]
MKNLFLICLLVVAVALSGCGDLSPKVIISPTPQDVKTALRDTTLDFPASVRISRLETFPSLTGNEVKIEILGGEKERAEIAAIFSESKEAVFPIQKIVSSKLNKDYPWHFKIDSAAQPDGHYLISIYGAQYYN